MSCSRITHLALVLGMLGASLLGCRPNADTTGASPASASTTVTQAPAATSAVNGPCTGLSVTADMQIWLDAGNLNIADGGSVSSWNDCHNSSLTAAQPAAISQPTLSATGGPNSAHAVAFDGIKSHLIIPGNQFTFATGLTIFLLAKFNPPPNAAFRYFLNDFDGTNGFSIALSSTTNHITPFLGMSGSDEGGVYPTSAWNLSNLVLYKTAMTEYLNGNPTGIASGNSLTASTSDMFLFVKKNGTQFNGYMGGMLAELLVYNTSMNDTDRLTVQCYLNTKYKLGLIACN